jgi:hypothetical protein
MAEVEAVGAAKVLAVPAAVEAVVMAEASGVVEALGMGWRR